MSKLDDVLSQNIFVAKGSDKLFFSLDATKKQIKELMLEELSDLLVSVNLNHKIWVEYEDVRKLINEL